MSNQKLAAGSARRYLPALALALSLTFGARRASAQSAPVAAPTPVPATDAPAAPLQGARSFQPQSSQLAKPSLATALILVDGKEMSLAQLNETVSPKNIEHIDVLKGDQAAATYGERGRRGVVLVSTKK